MHWIQREILKKLSTSERARYIELKPLGVDGNLFMYHLKQLMNDGYLIKIDKGYTLTRKGKTLVAETSLSTGQKTLVPRQLVMIYAKNSKGQIALYKWNRQPYIDHISLPFSRLRRGETYEKAARNTLINKLGQKKEPFYLGLVNVIVNKKDKISTHYTAVIFKAKLDDNVSADGLTGQPFWGTAKDVKTKSSVDGTSKMLNILKTKKSPIFEEIIINL